MNYVIVTMNRLINMPHCNPPSWDEQWRYLPQYLDDNLFRVNWGYISDRWKLSLDFIEKYQNYLDWAIISWKTLDDDFVIKFSHKIEWQYFFAASKLRSKFMIDYYLDNFHKPEHEFNLISILNQSSVSEELVIRLISDPSFPLKRREAVVFCQLVSNPSISEDFLIQNLNIFSAQLLVEVVRNLPSLSPRLLEAIEMYVLVSN